MSTDQPRTPAGAPAGGQFAGVDRPESDVDLEAPAGAPTSDAYGGYRLTKVRRMAGREGIAYSAVLTHDGQPVGHVTQEGSGGASFVRFEDRQDREAFAAFAAARSEPGAFEPEEDLLWRLETVDDMNRKRTEAFVLDGDDFWSSGQYRRARSTMSRAELLSSLRSLHASDNPKIWDRDAGDFVPLPEQE